MSSALGHFLERAADVHLPRFSAFFPASFDWMRLCADVPEMARRRGDTEPDPDSLEAERLLEARAQAVFSHAHLLGLAILAAGFSGADDPSTLLERLTTAPDDEEEETFDELVASSLALLEERLAAADGEAPAADATPDTPPDGGSDVERAEILVTAVWPAASEALTADDHQVFEGAGAQADLLWSLARVAVILAAFRWMAAERNAPDWPQASASE